MPDDKLMKSLLDVHNNTLRPHTDALKVAWGTALPEALRAMENSGIRQMMKDIEHHKEAMQAALAIEDLRRARVFDVDSRWLREIERAARFSLPEMTEIGRLMEEFRRSPLSEALARYAEQPSGLQLAIESMRSPWLDAQEGMRSIAGFAELQGIGHALRSMPAFSESLTAALRIDLGDWREPITWPPDIFTNLAARSDFYATLGFDHALTDFPPSAFEQSLDIAGLRQEPPLLAERYGVPIPSRDDEEEEEGLARTNVAHDWLQRLETQLRTFIDERMTLAFGADWAKHRLPNGLHEEWQEKKRKAEQTQGKERPLIAYADFTDYVRVICRGDNWREVFGAFFVRQESVRESFQRLYPIRLDTMHARPITQDDELLLYVETRRLVKVIL